VLPVSAETAQAPSGTLSVNAEITVSSNTVACPPGAPPNAGLCLSRVGAGLVPGLGHTTVAYMLIVLEPDPGTTCGHWAPTTGTLTVAGKGEIDVSLTDPTPDQTCVTPSTTRATLTADITRGTATYTGASGSFGLEAPLPTGNTAVDHWTGTLTVPGLAFDVTPPVLHGAARKTVHVPKRVKRARVRFSVTARDDVDGPVAVSCKPRSGTSFKLGRTTVRCSATDSSGNTAKTHFTVTVVQRKH
jgi:hypothetical protein